MNHFTISDLPLKGLKLVQRKQIGDARGFFSRIFCAQELASAGWTGSVAQINHTLTEKKGTVRGLHFQYPPHAEMKLVTCVRGEVWDIAVDIRKSSKTFLNWHGERLSARNGRAMLIPIGFAHGFQAITKNVELLYSHSTPYAPEFEDGLNPHDPALDIRWPLDIVELSKRDKNLPLVTSQFLGVEL